MCPMFPVSGRSLNGLGPGDVYIFVISATGGLATTLNAPSPSTPRKPGDGTLSVEGSLAVVRTRVGRASG